jgi:hypothetical protein
MDPKHTIKPLSLTADQKSIIRDYLKAFAAWDNMRYVDDPFDSFKRAEYVCMCDGMQTDLIRMYERVPQIAKDEFLS